MMTIDEYCAEHELSVYRLDGGFDHCVVGIDHGHNRLIYDAEQVVAVLRERDGLDEDAAWEYFEYNIASAYIGASTPVYIRLVQFAAPAAATVVAEEGGFVMGIAGGGETA